MISALRRTSNHTDCTIDPFFREEETLFCLYWQDEPRRTTPDILAPLATNTNRPPKVWDDREGIDTST